MDKDTRYYNKSLGELDETTLIRDRTGLNLANDQVSDNADALAASGSQLSETVAGSELDPAPNPTPSAVNTELELEWGLGASQPTAQLDDQPDHDSDSEEETEDENGNEASADEGDDGDTSPSTLRTDSATLPSEDKALFPLLEPGHPPPDVGVRENGMLTLRSINPWEKHSRPTRMMTIWYVGDPRVLLSPIRSSRTWSSIWILRIMRQRMG